MNLNDAREFSKIYKRVMDIELNLKNKFKSSLLSTFPNKMFYKLIPYIQGNLVGRYKTGIGQNTRDELLDLIASNKSEIQKIDKFFDMAYLSDILNMLINYKTLYQDANFINNFYGSKIIFNNLKQNSSRLKKLRNTIMHFNISDYNTMRADYLSALTFWEQLLCCTNCFMHNLPTIKPTIGNILVQMKNHYPDFYNVNDRHLCDLYDDIALKNGASVERLPLLWSIVRQIYEVKRHNSN